MTQSKQSGGHLGRTHQESMRWYEPRPAAPDGAPDIIYVVLDDVGYSDLGCFGSEIETPNFDSLAEQGLRYSNFHTTTLCSPTRASLLTGRNHHAVGMRYLANVDMGWPSGRGAITPKAATLAEMLKPHGYSTFAVGKWHLAPTEDANAAGPFDQWPLGRGFQRFYGFMNGGTSQFYPELVEDNRIATQPKTPEEGYHLSEDLVDKAIGMLSNKISLRPETPYFMHLCFGAGHFPHHAPKEVMEKYKGRFDHGWDEERTRRLARQKKLGVVRNDVELPPSNPGVAPWETLSDDEKRSATRLQEAYAALLDYTDQQFGRLLAFLEKVGRRDNTLIVLISDNGASIDCGPEGTANVLRWFNQLPDSTAENLAAYEEIGGPRSYSNYPWGWAQASNTPLKLYKSFTHGGGVRDPMIISWPKRIADSGGIRHQFHHVTDITPTVLELCGLSAPESVNGIAQMPIHGTSLAYSFDAPEAPTRKKTQYFEMYGHRSIWHDGWKAVTKHEAGSSFDSEHWELYHLDEDFSELHDLAESEPAKLQEMKERWWAEAGKYDVLPLDDSDNLFKPDPKPGSVRARNRFVYYPPIDAIPAEAAPLTQDVSHTITIELTYDETAPDGAILTAGNSYGGYGLILTGGRPAYIYNYCGRITELIADAPLSPGDHTIRFEFDKTGRLKGRARLLVDEALAAEGAIDAVLLRTSLSPLSVGEATQPPLSDRLSGTAPFPGLLNRIVFELGGDRDVVPDTLDVD